MGSGAVQVGAETAEQHQVREGKWFHGKVFERRNPPLRVISPPLANQTHVLPLTRNPTTVLWSNIPVNITPGLPAAPTSQPPVPSSTEVSTPLIDDLDPTVARFVRSTGLTRSLQRGMARGLFTNETCARFIAESLSARSINSDYSPKADKEGYVESNDSPGPAALRALRRCPSMSSPAAIAATYARPPGSGCLTQRILRSSQMHPVRTSMRTVRNA